MKKRKGKFSLLEAIDLLEATTSNGYPDNGTGVAGDDDAPPGNIVYGDKYKKTDYFNRLTSFQKIWDVDLSDWTWDEFEKSMGMEDFDNYSNTLQGMKDLFPEEVWKNIWKRMKNVPDELSTLRFKKSLWLHRKGGEDQIGSDREDHLEIDAKKDGSKFKDAEVTDKDIKESRLTNRISTLIV
jgi:hypothetical protein